MKLLAQSTVGDIFGKVSPPPGTENLSADPVAGVGKLLSTGLQLFIFVALVLLLVYLLWGALDWVTSGGEKEKISKAQNKIVNAVIGMLLVIVAFTVFAVITGSILGNKIIYNDPDRGWVFEIPHL